MFSSTRDNKTVSSTSSSRDKVKTSVEDGLCYTAILKILVAIHEEVQALKPEFFASNRNGEGCQQMYELKSKFITVVNYCNMFKFENLMVNYDVSNSYGYVYVFVPRSTRVLLTGVSENQLNIRLGRTMALTIYRSAFRVDAEILEYPMTRLIYKSDKNDRLYKRKSHRSENEPSLESSSSKSAGNQYELNADDLFDGDFSDDDGAAYLEEYEMAQQYDLNDYMAEQNELKQQQQSNEGKTESFSRQKKKCTCAEIFLLRRVSPAQVPHCRVQN